MFISHSSCCSVLYFSYHHIRQNLWHKIKCYETCFIASRIQNCLCPLKVLLAPGNRNPLTVNRGEEDIAGISAGVGNQTQPGPEQSRELGAGITQLVQPLSASHSLSSWILLRLLFARSLHCSLFEDVSAHAWLIMACLTLHCNLCQVPLLTKLFSAA